MLFPFLIAELKCGNGALHVADRHNAHIASVAVNAIVEIYRAISLQDELNQEVLAFSISHDHRAVRIYGHYPVIDGQHASFYRYPISSFDITNEGGKDRWKAYTFTRNVYDTFLLKHLERVLAAIDELPDPAILDVEPLS
ncbi:MAG: hypothetical protein M1832_000041 [Thelocarpon impressellum]|nr:MAG: hypothetical protein M1832_000041 [Thelocarpon impressellum]